MPACGRPAHKYRDLPPTVCSATMLMVLLEALCSWGARRNVGPYVAASNITISVSNALLLFRSLYRTCSRRARKDVDYTGERFDKAIKAGIRAGEVRAALPVTSLLHIFLWLAVKCGLSGGVCTVPSACVVPLPHACKQLSKSVDCF